MAITGFLSGLLNSSVSATTPLLLACLGEIISERAGVLNLGVEGTMLVGAFIGFVVTAMTGNPYLGLVVATAAATIFTLVHAVLSISLNADQVVSGVMLTLLGTGLTTYFSGGWTAVTIDGFQNLTIPVIGDYLVAIPVVGRAFFSNPAPNYIAFALVPVVWYLLFRTNLGLEIIAVGEDPETADSAGINVTRIRYLAVLLGGAFSGAAGATLSLAYLELWTPGMVNARGWIAVALVIFSQWRPVRALFGAYLFGVIAAFAIRSQGIDVASWVSFSPTLSDVVGVLFSPNIMSTYPYIATIGVLVYISYKSRIEEIGAPSALLKPYERESG